ncbi:SMC5-SMC6 complex localization factor protein 1 isoform X2 [Hippocampus zosterae]|uniref:SMC5-SMC6 complex localization factor protein 1 isoform X2 n=1 Tax=Hippocampus zosterae TaxID=109293 RepID=UPI00223D8F2D|nr:SMC5-SMC6 complex localization factor protein 1 isoform X2 [Hippocampus zosterae]
MSELTQLGMERCIPVFQISGIKNRDKKRALLRGIHQLGGKYVGTSVYQNAGTHLIIPQVLASEKFLAFCAAGKWVVTPNYVLDSVRNRSWLPEGPYEVAVPTDPMSAFYPVRQWREKVTSGAITGAFQGWMVLLMIQDSSRSVMFKRLLEAGSATVYSYPPPFHASITHVIAKPFTPEAITYNSPCFPVSHIVQYLFESNFLHMKFNITDVNDDLTEPSVVDVDFSQLEADLREHAIKQESHPRLLFLEFLDNHAPHQPLSQATETDFSNISTMIECGLFIEALDTIRSTLFPGILPPAQYLVSLIDYAQQGSATTIFLNSFRQIMHRLLITNPPWMSPTFKEYYGCVLQCPRCKMGMWPFLETAISYCLSSEATCHQLPGPALPTLLHFHSDVVAFFLKLFQGELHSINMGDFRQLPEPGDYQGSISGSLLYGTFWTVWERSTLLSHAVKKLVQLTTQAASEDHTDGDKKYTTHLLTILLDLLSVLVEFWCTQHFKLNQKLVENGLKDLAEHFAITSQYLSPEVLTEMVARISSTRLKLVLVDAIFRNICCKNGIRMDGGPLSLKKMALSYLPALGLLAQCHSWTQSTTNNCVSLNTNSGTLSPVENESENECIPRGLHKVNAAGETLLHRACKRNQVETVLHILSRPGIDVNVQDHVGWTPLHEACNNGSTACVEALLRHRPPPVINCVVEGISPLHDALLNGHMDIAKMLLEAAGSELLHQTDEKGRTALELVTDIHWRAALIRSAQAGDSSLNSTTVLNHALLEAGSCLLAHLIVCYKREKRPPCCEHSTDVGRTLARALEAHSFPRVTLGWTDQRAISIAGDTEILLEMARGTHWAHVCKAVKESKGENAVLLLQMLENLQSEGKILLAEINPLRAH